MDFLNDGAVAAAVCVYALHEMTEPLAALREVRRVLQADGKMLIVDFPRDSLAQRLWDEKYHTHKQIGALLRRAGFSRITVQPVYRDQMVWARGSCSAAKSISGRVGEAPRRSSSCGTSGHVARKQG